MSGESMECGSPDALDGDEDGELAGMRDYGHKGARISRGNPTRLKA
jgi:hypothetical protein